MSAKLLLNLVECIARKNDSANPTLSTESSNSNPNLSLMNTSGTNTSGTGKGRALLVRILDAFVNKFSSLKKQIPKILDTSPTAKPSNQLQQASSDENNANALRSASSNNNKSDSAVDSSVAGKSETGVNSAKQLSKNADAIRGIVGLCNWFVITKSVSLDCRLLMKTLVFGLKNIVWGISSCSPNRNSNPAPGISGLPISGKLLLLFHKYGCMNLIQVQTNCIYKFQ
jgi:hypothetical protein